MKKIVTIISFLSVFSISNCFAFTPGQEEKFITQLRSILANKDKNAYIAIHFLDGATDKQKASIVRDADFYFSKKYTILEIRDRDSSQPSERDIGGVKHVLNLSSSKVLHMEFTNEMNATSRTQRALGDKDGKLMFSLFVPAK